MFKTNNSLTEKLKNPCVQAPSGIVESKRAPMVLDVRYNIWRAFWSHQSGHLA